MSAIAVIRHVAFEGPGSIADYAAEKGLRIDDYKLFEDTALPDPAQYRLVVIMGGPMGIYDDRDHPWLKAEREWLKVAVETGTPFLGICLGSQLLADSLGAKVYNNDLKEIGWFPVDATDGALTGFGLDEANRQFDAFHWHGDTFELPDGAAHLFSTPECTQQGFLHSSKILALQFHLEVTEASLSDMILHGLEELEPAPKIQSADAMREGLNRIPRCNRLMATFLDHLLAA